MSKLHEKLWAKSVDKSFNSNGEGESLFQHSINVARNTQHICERLPFPIEKRQELSEFLLEAGVFHDIGKTASGFQKMLRMSRKEIIEQGGWGHRHETLSTALACVLNLNLDETVLFAILTHHRNIPPSRTSGEGEKCLPIHELPPSFGGTSDVEWKKMLEELRENWSEFEDLLNSLIHELGLQWSEIKLDEKFLSLKLNPKWLNRDYQKKLDVEKRWQASLLRGLLITSDHLASAVEPTTGNHPKIPNIPNLLDFKSKIEQIELPTNAKLLPFQQRSLETNGNAILKAPTGSGKTLAAILWAGNNQLENGRFFYILPFTASINAMAKRFGEIFGEQSVGVLHHRNADYLFRMMEQDELSVQLKNKQAKHLQSLAKEMYHPIRISTPHQILRFALRGRGWETGLAEFHNACFVFDEIHAFEPLITGLTLATAKLLKGIDFNAKILFTSATIPKFLENIIKEYLEIDELNVIEPNPNSEDSLVCNKKRHKIEIRKGNLFDNLNEIVREIKSKKQSTLIFCNHVKTSQQIYEKLKTEYGFKDLTLLHSRFNGRDRTKIENKITTKRTVEQKIALKKLIEAEPLRIPVLVATQAVEVSLDIDYERGYSEPAPADALGQRFGRINRKGSRSAEDIIIFEEPTNGYLYDESLTNKTVQLFQEINEELSEQDLTKIVDKVYENGYSPESESEFRKGLDNEDIKYFSDEIIAGTHRNWTDYIFEKTDAQIEVLPNSLLKEFSAFNKQKRFVEEKRLLVPIRWGTYHNAKKLNAVRYDEKLRVFIVTLSYDHKRGLDSDKLDNENII